MSKKMIMNCGECGSRNYVLPAAKKAEERFTVKKFCSHCNAHTVHKQTV